MARYDLARLGDRIQIGLSGYLDGYCYGRDHEPIGERIAEYAEAPMADDPAMAAAERFARPHQMSDGAQARAIYALRWQHGLMHGRLDRDRLAGLPIRDEAAIAVPAALAPTTLWE